MADKTDKTDKTDVELDPRIDQNIYLAITTVLQGLLGVALIWFFVRGSWENVFLTALVMGLTLLPALLRRHYRVRIPPEFQLISAAFVCLSLFLGSAADFYYKYWWWDVILHVSSGFLLGIAGVIVMLVLNETERIPRGMKPIFVCVFAVTFALTIGVIWEIFEFVVDRIAPAIDMQSNGTGVVDTMKDLIGDLCGAIVVATMSWMYLKTGRFSFVFDGVRRFVRSNRFLFRKSRQRASRG